jgi:glycosyltransferase involved in cell wall biosynthesis
MPKSILFFHSVTQIGGAETNIIKISKLLADLNFQVHFATLENNGPMWKQCPHATSFTEVGLFSKNPLAAINTYKNLVQSYRFDYVLNFGLRVELFSRLLTSAFSPDTRIVSNIRSTDHDRNLFHTLADIITQPYVFTWVANSIAGKQAFVRRELIDEKNIAVIYNFIQAIHKSQTERSLNTAYPRIGILANIRKLKGHYDLIAICKQLQQINIYPIFVCGGVDNTQGHFAKEVLAAGLVDRFEFIGFVSDKQVFFDQIDLFLLPSYLEGMPTVVLEAMSFGVPVIASDIDGIPEQIVHMHNGWLCEAGNIDSYVQAISGMLNNESMRKQFVEQSYVQLKNYFLQDTSMNKWLEILNCK